MAKFNKFQENKHYFVISVYAVISAIVLFIAYQMIIHINTILVSIGALLGSLLSALSPLIIGLIIAFLIGPLVKLVDQKIITRIFHKSPGDPIKASKKEKRIHTLSILLTFLIILVALGAVIYTLAVLIVGQLVFSSVNQMTQSIIDYFLKYEQILRDLIDKIPGTGFDEKLKDAGNMIINWISNNFNTVSIMNFVLALGGSFLNLFLGIMVSLYLLLDAAFFKRLWQKILSIVLPSDTAAKVNDTLKEINTVIGQFLRGALLDALIVAILASIGLSIVGLDFAVFIGFFAGLANVIPYFGPYLGMIPAIIVALLTGGPTQALLAVLVLFIIQQLDGSIIAPKIMGTSTGLSPVFILVAVILGGYYWGIVGMLLAVPTAAIIRLFLGKRFGSI